jgi:hypothetical protein
MAAVSARTHGVDPKFKTGDIVYVSERARRLFGFTFTIYHRQWDSHARQWYYRDQAGMLYPQHALTMAAPGKH